MPDSVRPGSVPGGVVYSPFLVCPSMITVVWTTDVSRTSARAEEVDVIVIGLQHRIADRLVSRMKILLGNHFPFPSRHSFSLSKTLVIMCRRPPIIHEIYIF